MTINASCISSQINSKILNNDLTELELLQLSGAASSLLSVYSVDTVLDLPSPQENTGRLIYVKSVDNYRYSDGVLWLTEYDSNLLIENKVYAWGVGNSGQLGDGTVSTKNSAVSVVGGFTDWCQVSAGTNHTAAVRTTGTVWTWGQGTYGRLGTGGASNQSSPVSVIGGFTDWSQVSAGNAHTAAVRANGTLWSWGLGTSGQLGNGASSNRSSPVSVVGGFTDWCRVSAGSAHNAAVRTNGTLWSWGAGTCGRLGDNTIVGKSSPVSLVGGFTDWCQVSAGWCHTIAARTNGTLWSWGLGTCGRLGDNGITTRTSPVSVVGGFTDWCQFSAGCIHSIAVRTNGTVWTWGLGTSGQLGDGFAVTRTSPVSVVGGFTDWCQVSAGISHTAAIRSNGTLWAWGLGTSGQLGNGINISQSSPVSVVGGLTDWCQVSAGAFHTAAVVVNVRGF